MTQAPKTLGEKLTPLVPEEVAHKADHMSGVQKSLRVAVLIFYAITILTVIYVLPDLHIGGVIFGVLSWIVLRFALFFPKRRRTRAAPQKVHFLLEHDHLNFMGQLALHAKTAVIDGSNIYHFGHSNDLDAQVLGGVVAQLRDEGYRIVCFFDANIYYTLSDHGVFHERVRHEHPLLQGIFGLEKNEIYVVPSGVQADKYVLTCLHHLPLSFAVTNDKFRDYAKQFVSVMKGDELSLIHI